MQYLVQAHSRCLLTVRTRTENKLQSYVIMPASYTHNYVVDTYGGGLQCIAGKNYDVGDVVDRAVFIVDGKNGLMPSLFKRNDVHPYGVVNNYVGVLMNHNVEVHSIDDYSRYAVIKAVRKIKQGDVILYKLEVKANPINRRVCVDYIATSTVPGAGMGVFAGKDYKRGELVALNPFEIIQNETSTMNMYAFSGKKASKCTISSLQDTAKDIEGKLDVQGIISLMNHSSKNDMGIPNVFPYNVDHARKLVVATAWLDIKEGDELFIDYGVGYWQSTLRRLMKPVHAELKHRYPRIESS